MPTTYVNMRNKSSSIGYNGTPPFTTHFPLDLNSQFCQHLVSVYAGNILIIVFYHTNANRSNFKDISSHIPIWKRAMHKGIFAVDFKIVLFQYCLRLFRCTLREFYRLCRASYKGYFMLSVTFLTIFIGSMRNFSCLINWKYAPIANSVRLTLQPAIIIRISVQYHDI